MQPTIRSATVMSMAVSVLAAGLVAACSDSSGSSVPIDATIDAEIGMHTLTGIVLYEDRAQQQSGRLASTIQNLPARAISVALLADDDSTVIASAVTGDDGRYTLEFVGGPSESVHLLAAAVSVNPQRPLRVLRQDGMVHGFGGGSFPLEATDAALVITEASGEAEAFNVFDQMVSSADAVRIGLGIAPSPVRAQWQKGGTTGTFYSGSTLFLLGSASDDDGYDDTVILHENGHFIEDSIGRSDSPGGSHDGSPTNPTLAWSEGFSTYWAMAVKGIPFYGDSNAGGGWGYNGENTVTRAPQPAGPLEQPVPENMITEVLWDIGDMRANDDDPLAGDQLLVENVQPDYLRTAALRQIGRAGVDLVDFLDGYLLADSNAHCAAVTTIVVTRHTFPYDFGGPAGPCL
jgi:hypothetical protein